MPCLTVRIALALASLCLPTPGPRARNAGRHLADELDRQIFPDGGHISRDPSALVMLLPDLIALRETYVGRSLPVPKGLFRAIDRMLPAVRFFRHSDGSLALFNGAGLSDMHMMTVLMRYDETLGEPITHARQSGYHRLAGGDAVVIADTGCPPPASASSGAHAGTLAFELSSGANRLIVNCGRPALSDGEWRRLSRATAAHSTVTIADRSSSRFARSESLDRFLGTPLVPGPTVVNVEEVEDRAGCGFLAIHDGYERQFGVRHRRRLTISRDGLRVFGEDAFVPAGHRAAQLCAATATARFHLHPAVNISQAGRGARLATRDQSWLFVVDAPFEVEDSIFFADVSGARRTLQIVVPFDVADADGISWRFERER